MQNVIDLYKKNKKQEKMSKLLMVIGVLVLGVSVLSGGFEASSLTGIAVAIMGYGMLKSSEEKEVQIIEEYKREIENLQLERNNIKQVTIKNETAHMEFEDGSLIQKEVEIVRTHIRNPFLETKKMPIELEKIPELKEKFPRPIMFIPNKPVESVVFEESKNV